MFRITGDPELCTANEVYGNHVAKALVGVLVTDFYLDLLLCDEVHKVFVEKYAVVSVQSVVFNYVEAETFRGNFAGNYNGVTAIE